MAVPKRKPQRNEKKDGGSSSQHAKIGKVTAPQVSVAEEAQPSLTAKRNNEENVVAERQKVLEVMPTLPLAGMVPKKQHNLKNLVKNKATNHSRSSWPEAYELVCPQVWRPTNILIFPIWSYLWTTTQRWGRHGTTKPLQSNQRPKSQEKRCYFHHKRSETSKTCESWHSWWPGLGSSRLSSNAGSAAHSNCGKTGY